MPIDARIQGNPTRCFRGNPIKCSCIDNYTARSILCRVHLEVRAIGLRAIRDQRQLTQRELACSLGISQNYVPALESGARRPGPRLRRLLMEFFGCHFEDLFQVVMVIPEGAPEGVLSPQHEQRAV